MQCKVVLGCSDNMRPGCQVYGKVQCKFCANETIKEIRCVLKGLELVGTNTGRNLSGVKEFLTMRLCLVHRGIVKAGRYEYPFSFILPEDIPSSYETDNAEIQYIVKSIIDIPFNHQEDKVKLFITSKVNLNRLLHELQLKPYTHESHNTVGCWCWASTPVVMNVTFEKDAYVLGETVNMKICIKNDSMTNIESILVTLKRILEYKNHESDKKSNTKTKEIVASQLFPGVEANKEETVFANFVIPVNIEIFNFILCSLIREAFILQIEAVQSQSTVYVETRLHLGHTGAISEEMANLGTGEGLNSIPSRQGERAIRSRSRDSFSTIGTSRNYRLASQDKIKFVPSIHECNSYPESKFASPVEKNVSFAPTGDGNNFIPTGTTNSSFAPMGQEQLFYSSSMFDQRLQK